MHKTVWRSAFAGFCLAALAGCGFEPIPMSDTGGMKPGPGLLTGKSGEFVILSRP